MREHGRAAQGRCAGAGRPRNRVLYRGEVRGRAARWRQDCRRGSDDRMQADRHALRAGANHQYQRRRRRQHRGRRGSAWAVRAVRREVTVGSRLWHARGIASGGHRLAVDRADVVEARNWRRRCVGRERRQRVQRQRNKRDPESKAAHHRGHCTQPGGRCASGSYRAWRASTMRLHLASALTRCTPGRQNGPLTR